MDWMEFIKQTGEVITAAQDDIRESEASLCHEEGCRMGVKLDEPSRQKARLQRKKLQDRYLALRERREILLTAPDGTPGRDKGIQNLEQLIKRMKSQLRLI